MVHDAGNGRTVTTGELLLGAAVYLAALALFAWGWFA